MISYTLHFQPPSDERLLANAYGKLLHEKESGITGYYNLPEDSLPLFEEVQAHMERQRLCKECDTVALIGIGGSSLGTKAIYSLFKHQIQKRMIFLENPDPLSLGAAFEEIDKERTIFVVVSKSGRTIETLSIFKTAIEHFHIDFEEDKDRVIVITDLDSQLHRFAESEGLKSFSIPHNVGGRFSVLSAVGVVPLTLAGLPMDQVLGGARQMVERFFAGEERHILQKALFYYQHRTTRPINVLFSYADALEHFNQWYLQLWAESLGKKDRFGKSVGLTPVGHIGAVDQHSFLQLVMDGPKDKTLTFINIEKWPMDITIPDLSLPHLQSSDFVNTLAMSCLLNEECEATKQSVISQGIPTDSITLDTLSLENAGELIVYYELLTSATGALLDINTYDQPGVELGKRILKEKLSHER